MHPRAAEPPAVVPLAPRSVLFDDFRSRLEAAIASRDPRSIRALYLASGVDSEGLKSELARWQEQIAGSGEAKVSLMFKELGTLPPKARQSWTRIAQQLTQAEVTHLVGVTITPRPPFRLLPLRLLNGRLWIVPSDAKGNASGIELGQPAPAQAPSRAPEVK